VGQAIPPRERIADRLGELAFGAEQALALFKIAAEIIDNRAAAFVADETQAPHKSLK